LAVAVAIPAELERDAARDAARAWRLGGDPADQRLAARVLDLLDLVVVEPAVAVVIACTSIAGTPLQRVVRTRWFTPLGQPRS